MGYIGRVAQIPLEFTPSETADRRNWTGIAGKLILSPPLPGFLPTVKAVPMRYPLNLYGAIALPAYLDQRTYPNMQLGKSFDQLEPLVFPDKYLHQILDLR